jgi:transposase
MMAPVPAEAIVYVDETGVDESLHREMCRARRGEKVCGSVSGRRYHRTNVVAGECRGRIIAPMEYAGHTDHCVFEDWFENALLAGLPEGSTIVMDNASFHRKKALRGLAEKAKSRVVFLPAYSPDYNPIEKTWANMKAFLRNYVFQFESLQSAIEFYFKNKRQI